MWNKLKGVKRLLKFKKFIEKDQRVKQILEMNLKWILACQKWKTNSSMLQVEVSLK